MVNEISERLKKKSQIELENYLKQKKELEEMFQEIAVINNPAIKKFFKLLVLKSGAMFPPIIVSESTGHISTEAMLYNEGRRSMYMDFREFIPKVFRSDIEDIQVQTVAREG